MHTPIQESSSVVFKHFRVLLAPCVINIYLENSFYIDINKNIISYLNTQKLFFVILLPICCNLVFHPLFLIHFGKQFQDKLWLGVGLGRCDSGGQGCKSQFVKGFTSSIKMQIKCKYLRRTSLIINQSGKYKQIE